MREWWMSLPAYIRVYVCYLCLCSLVAFVAYGVDKLKAIRGAWRISEKALLLLSVLGGGIGGYLAMQLFRHKTRHWYFHVVNLFGIVWQVALLIFLLTPA